MDNAIPVEVEEEPTVPEAPLTMAELAARCECGCRRGKHTDGELECMGCGCVEFKAPPPPCSHCGGYHDPADSEALAAEALS